MSEGLEPIRRSVTVSPPPERAFRLFTEEMSTWWPAETHSRATAEHDGVAVERIEFEGRPGGRVLEHMSNGATASWAEVLIWDPPRRFVLAWKPHSRPEPPTEVEVRFTPHGQGTLVELEHRGWERLGEAAPEGHGSYAAGWIVTLERFAEAAEGRAA